MIHQRWREIIWGRVFPWNQWLESRPLKVGKYNLMIEKKILLASNYIVWRVKVKPTKFICCVKSWSHITNGHLCYLLRLTRVTNTAHNATPMRHNRLKCFELNSYFFAIPWYKLAKQGIVLLRYCFNFYFYLLSMLKFIITELVHHSQIHHRAYKDNILCINRVKNLTFIAFMFLPPNLTKKEQDKVLG